MPGIGVSIFLFAVGAILAFAVNVTTQGLDLNTVGVILMLVGGVGFVASMLFWAPWAPYGRDRSVYHEREVIEREPHTHAH